MAGRTYFNRKVSPGVVAEKAVYMISRSAVTKRCGLLTCKQSVLATAHLLQNQFLYSKTSVVPIGQSSRTKLMPNLKKQYPIHILSIKSNKNDIFSSVWLLTSKQLN